MQSLDYAVLFCYVAGMFLVGGIFSTRIKSSADMFAAGGQSPWWTSGLSAFMTMFSANTFVVWGGIAYRLGIVAVAINLMYGVSALLVGYFVAGRWKKLGIETPAQYIQLRFGSGALHFYTWSMMIFRMVGTAGALYALGKILVTLMPLSAGHPLRDAATGNFSLAWAIVIFGSIVVVYTMIGGLWAVLMTDVLQFIVLNLAVLFVVPLILMRAGGVGGFINQAPAGFFAPVGGDYTWLFLAGWCAIHFFMIGAEWAFVQRFICVPTAKDARKSTYLFGVLYLFSPLVWLLPPMVWRVLAPIPAGATAEQIRNLAEEAYIASCHSVLPVGMIGLMVAAMFSATASMVSSQLNVFSGVLTNDIYKPLMRVSDGNHNLVWVGRACTVLLGVLLIAIALMIPALGGAETVIVNVTELLVVALLAPTLWGLFSRRVDAKAVWVTAGVSFTAGVMVRFGLSEDGFLSTQPGLESIATWVQQHGSAMKTLTGVVLPVLVLCVMQLTARHTAVGCERIEALEATQAARKSAQPAMPSRLPGVIVGWSIATCGVMMAALIPFNTSDRWLLAAFAGVTWIISALVLFSMRRSVNLVESDISHAKATG